jgi:hypothetical protein
MCSKQGTQPQTKCPKRSHTSPTSLCAYVHKEATPASNLCPKRSHARAKFHHSSLVLVAKIIIIISIAPVIIFTFTFISVAPSFVSCHKGAKEY